MSASEIKYVYSEWESKGQAVLLPYALQYNYEEIDGLLKDMNNIANEAGLGGIGYQSQEFATKFEIFTTKRIAVIS